MREPQRWLWPLSSSTFLQHENSQCIPYACPPYAQSDILAPDSDDEPDLEIRQSKKRKVVRLAKSYISGNPLFIASAALRGPFDKRTGQQRTIAETPHDHEVVAAPLPIPCPVHEQFVKPKSHHFISKYFVPRTRQDLPEPDFALTPNITSPTPFRPGIVYTLDSVLLPSRKRRVKTKSRLPSSLSSGGLLTPPRGPRSRDVSDNIVADPEVSPQKYPLSQKRRSALPKAFDDEEQATSPHHGRAWKPELETQTHAKTAAKVATREHEQDSARTSPAVVKDREKQHNANVIKQKLIRQCLQTGKLPSLNRLSSSAGNKPGNDTKSNVDDSPFIFRKVQHKSPSKFFDDTPSNVPTDGPATANTPLISTQAALDRAHEALLETIRRERRKSPHRSVDHFDMQQKGTGLANPTSHGTGEPIAKTAVATPPVNTQAMFDAFSPFSARATDKNVKRSASSLPKDNRSPAIERLRSAPRQHTIQLSATDDIFSIPLSPEREMTVLPKASSQHALTGKQSREVIDNLPPGSETDDNDRALGVALPALPPPADPYQEQNMELDQDIVNEHEHEHEHEYEQDDDFEMPRFDQITSPMALDATSATVDPSVLSLLPPDEIGSNPHFLDPLGSIKSSLQNAQREPSIDVEMSLDQIEASVFEPWSVEQVVRQGIEAT